MKKLVALGVLAGVGLWLAVQTKERVREAEREAELWAAATRPA